MRRKPGQILALRAEVPEAYRAHPLLDPLLPSRQAATARFWLAAYRRLKRSPESASQLLRSSASALGTAERPSSDPASYFEDSDRYCDDLLGLVASPMKERLRVLSAVRGTSDLGELLRIAFEGPDPRTRYEAQRKLYLAKLLFDVDHCRSVLDGPRHHALLGTLLQKSLWVEMEGCGEVEICCRLVSQGAGRERLEVGVPPSGDARCWRFQLRRLPPRDGEPGIEVFHHKTRFKRDASDLVVERTVDGALSLTEATRWPGLGKRSGSILSKMIRRGLGDPNMVQDLLGAMFIVGDRRQVYALERRLVRALGGPFRCRDRVDTISREKDRERLSPHSSASFQVLKQIVDVLVDDPAGSSPYLFPVEIQIYPLEAYLSTLHDAHFASHAAYKRRQFLNDLLPVLFPAQVYGEHAYG